MSCRPTKSWRVAQPPPRVVDSPNGAVRFAGREQLLRLMEPVIALRLDRLRSGFSAIARGP
jgi:hypothetical protein